MTIEEYPNTLATTALLHARHGIFKSKASTQQTIPLKMDAFRSTNTREPQPNASDRAGEMEDSRQVDSYDLFCYFRPGQLKTKIKRMNNFKILK